MGTGGSSNRLPAVLITGRAWLAVVAVLSVAAPVSASITTGPTLTVTASPSTRIGLQVFANVNITSASTPTGTLTFRLFGPSDPACASVPAFTSTVAVTGTSVNSQRFVTDQAGTWRWTASYSGDAANGAVGPTPCAEPTAAVVVEKARTVLSLAAPAADGTSIHGSATISGGVAPTGNITFSLSPPGDTFCNTPVFTSTVPVAGNGTYQSAPFTASLAGDYTWRASYSGDADNLGVSVTPCLDVDARVTVALHPGGLFHAVEPTRILDTRTGFDAPAGAIGPDASLDVQVTGQGGMPSTGVSAVVLNVTVTEPTSAGFLTVWPAGEARSSASNVNFGAGQTVANAVTAAVGAGGRVTVYNAVGTSHVIADVTGWYGDGTETAGSRFHPVAPNRILDSRLATGTPVALLAAGATLDVQVAGQGGVPATGVSAVVLNLTITQPAAAGFLTVWPSGRPRPAASSLNFAADQTTANSVTVALGAGGQVAVYNWGGATHVIADVAGWYGDGTDTAGAVFHPVSPARVADTRLGLGAPAAPLASRSTLDVQVAGQAGVPAGAAAVVLNVAVTEPAWGGHLEVWAAGQDPGPMSTLNFAAGQTVANQVVTALGGGRVTVYNGGGPADVVVDVGGWFGGT